jgi:radical SAM protein with 4Fe4S-binding SPASM domain
MSRLRKALHGDVKYYCQKPWTDLHNFTVDGRMDVCCIATGESQTRYALGNLLTQSFQEVWNGPAAREFRRTVNSGNPLPPCRRCPMAFAYQGPMFNPTGAQRRAGEYIAILRHLPFGRRIVRVLTGVSDGFISHVLFRGFKR